MEHLLAVTISEVHFGVMEQPNPNRVAKTDMERRRSGPYVIGHIPRIQTGPKNLDSNQVKHVHEDLKSNKGDNEAIVDWVERHVETT